MQTDHDRIVVAMSGGVDSSVAALLLQQQGANILGVSMQVWDYRKNGGCDSRATCCSPDDFTDARKVAAKIGIPYYVFDLEEYFKEEVIDRFVETYRQGLTPNPCVDCNNRVKFRELRKRSDSLGCSAVATGHYARITCDDSGYHLLRGLDRSKDQSYFLYGLAQAELPRTVFPLGELTKPEVREIARGFGLATANKAESQDICFVSGSVSDFLVQLGGRMSAGDIVRSSGEKVGEHDGLHGFTVGQRRGLNVGGNSEPLYVLELDTAKNRVVIGSRAELEIEGFKVSEVNWIAPECIEAIQREGQVKLRCLAQLRHRHAGVPVDMHWTASNGVAKVSFVEEHSTVSPGQAAVFYDLDGTEVLGGGRIEAQALRA